MTSVTLIFSTKHTIIATTSFNPIRHVVPSKKVLWLGFTVFRHTWLPFFRKFLAFFEVHDAHRQSHPNFAAFIFSTRIGSLHHSGGVLLLDGMHPISSKNCWLAAGDPTRGGKEWKIEKFSNFGCKRGCFEFIANQWPTTRLLETVTGYGSDNLTTRLLADSVTRRHDTLIRLVDDAITRLLCYSTTRYRWIRRLSKSITRLHVDWRHDDRCHVDWPTELDDTISRRHDDGIRKVSRNTIFRKIISRAHNSPKIQFQNNTISRKHNFPKAQFPENTMCAAIQHTPSPLSNPLVIFQCTIPRTKGGWGGRSRPVGSRGEAPVWGNINIILFL